MAANRKVVDLESVESDLIKIVNRFVTRVKSFINDNLTKANPDGVLCQELEDYLLPIRSMQLQLEDFCDLDR